MRRRVSNHSRADTTAFFLRTALWLVLFALTSCGGGGNGNSGTSGAANAPPVANNACFAIHDGDGSLALTLTGSDPNGNDTIASYSIESLPATGTIVGCSTAPCSSVSGNFMYVPDANSTGRRGMDKFTFRVTDSSGLTSPIATAWILNNGKMRIMPLGDSITQGVVNSNGCDPDGNCPIADDRIGYRKTLIADLKVNYPAVFVGSQANGSGAGLIPPDDRHEGHPGWCAGPNGADPTYCASQSIASNIISWLDANPPDILLVHVGTNSFTTSASDVQLLLDNIDTWEASNYPVTVFLARILDDVPNYLTDKDTTTFNNNVECMVTGQIAGIACGSPGRINDRVIMVNMETGAGILYGDGAPGPDMGDNVHPNDSGYGKMANKWLADLTNPVNIGPKFTGLPQCP